MCTWFCDTIQKNSNCIHNSGTMFCIQQILSSRNHVIPLISTVRNIRMGKYYAKVVVKFTDAPYHENQFFGLRQTLKREYPGTVVIGEQLSNNGDCFEVIVNGQLVHSKLNGDGFIDADIKKERIVIAVEDLLVKENPDFVEENQKIRLKV